MTVKVLSCKCGDCLHWEVVQKPAGATQILKCKTCETEYPVKLEVDPHDQLEWVEHAKA